MGDFQHAGIARVALPLAAAAVALLLSAAASGEPVPPTAGFPAQSAEAVTAPAPTPAPTAPASATPKTAAAANPAPAPEATPRTPATSSTPAPAEPPPPLPAAPAFPVAEPAPRNISLTISPLRLLVPMFEAAIEVRVGPLGIALLGGAGQVAIEGGELDGERLAAYELGGIVNAYPLEKFESLSLGAELLWLKINADDIGADRIRGFASGVAVGPLIGYKTIGRTGFTFAAQAGVAYVVLHAEATNAYYDREEEDDETLIPLVNLNLGWSF